MNLNLNIKIIGKERPGNRTDRGSNKVYFTLNDDELSIDIIYLENLQVNAFIECPSYENVERYCKRKDIDFELFKSLFLYMLYKYSRGIGLKVVEDPRKEE